MPLMCYIIRMAKKTTSKKPKTVKSAKKTAVKKTEIAAKAEAAKTPKKISLKRLQRWNILLALVLAGQALAITILGKTATLPITANLLNEDALASQAAGHRVLVAATRHLFDINMVVIVAVFLLISAVFHGLIATYAKSKYEQQVSHGVNKLRWIDYGLSASVMLVAVAMISGVYDLASLMMIFVLVVLLHVFGYFLETQKSAAVEARRNSLKGLLVAGGTVWLAIAIYVKAAVIYGVGLPRYVYYIDGSIFVITLGLAFNTYKSFKRTGRWSDYLYGEQAYMLLSMIAKSALAWQIYAGLLR